MKPYFQDDAVTIYHADCRDILPVLEPGSVDLVLTDPPYGIGKAEWDDVFPLWWLDEASRLARRVGLMAGTWNLLSCPQQFGDMSYRWTLSAHLVNGMTRGRLGFQNWIPCVVYGKDYSATPYRYAVLRWCRAFGDWCRTVGIRNKDLDAACGTSSMGDWWTGRSLPWVRIPSPSHWDKIQAVFNPPEQFTHRPECAETSYVPVQDCKDFSVGSEPMPDHPCPKPLSVMRWFIEAIGGETILDPFMGSGTTLRAAKDLGRKAIGVEIEEKYCEIAARRMQQAVLFT